MNLKIFPHHILMINFFWQESFNIKWRNNRKLFIRHNTYICIQFPLGNPIWLNHYNSLNSSTKWKSKTKQEIKAVDIFYSKDLLGLSGDTMQKTNSFFLVFFLIIDLFPTSHTFTLVCRVSNPDPLVLPGSEFH